MAFDPNVRDRFIINGVTYEMAEHPAAKGIAYGQAGRMATAYQLINVDAPGDRHALKVIKEKWRVPALVALAQKLEPLAELPGLAVCRRMVLNARQHGNLLRQHPDLLYAPLMPWMSGPTWMQIILEQRVLSPKQSLALARTLAEVLTALEERGVAHCDLSGPNLIITSMPDDQELSPPCSMALVDVEQLFGPGLDSPSLLAAGSPGYAHKASPKGLWSADADRFAGAILLTEMLGFCDDAVRRAAAGESYFTPEEIQHDSARLQILRASLRVGWGEGILNLFDRVWTSEALCNCPTLGEWLVTLPLTAPATIADTGNARPAQIEMLKPPPELVVEVKPPPSDTAIRPPILSPSTPNLATAAGSPLMGWRQLNGTVTPPTTPMTSESASIPDPQPTISQVTRSATQLPFSPPTPAPAFDRGLASGEWKPRIPKFDRTRAIVSVVGLIAALGAALFVVVLVFGTTIAGARQSLLVAFGDTGVVIANTALMAALTGAAQVWVFRNQVKGINRLWFGLATLLGGIVGGLVGQMVMGTRSSLVGAIYGLVGGAVASLGQNALMRRSGLQATWLVWNVAGWGIIWLIGWTISWGIGGTLGNATSAAFMMIATGLLLGLFLKTYPNIEF